MASVKSLGWMETGRRILYSVSVIFSLTFGMYFLVYSLLEGKIWYLVISAAVLLLSLYIRSKRLFMPKHQREKATLFGLVFVSLSLVGLTAFYLGLEPALAENLPEEQFIRLSGDFLSSVYDRFPWIPSLIIGVPYILLISLAVGKED